MLPTQKNNSLKQNGKSPLVHRTSEWRREDACREPGEARKDYGMGGEGDTSPRGRRARLAPAHARSRRHELIAEGEIDVVKVGRSTFIRYASLKRLFERS